MSSPTIVSLFFFESVKKEPKQFKIKLSKISVNLDNCSCGVGKELYTEMNKKIYEFDSINTEKQKMFDSINTEKQKTIDSMNTDKANKEKTISELNEKVKNLTNEKDKLLAEIR